MPLKGNSVFVETKPREKGWTIIVAFLLSNDRDIDQIKNLNPNSQDKIALTYAAFKGYTKIAELLVNDGRYDTVVRTQTLPMMMKRRVYSSQGNFDMNFALSDSIPHDIAVYEGHFDVADVIRSSPGVVVDFDRLEEVSQINRNAEKYRSRILLNKSAIDKYDSWIPDRERTSYETSKFIFHQIYTGGISPTLTNAMSRELLGSIRTAVKIGDEEFLTEAAELLKNVDRSETSLATLKEVLYDVMASNSIKDETRDTTVKLFADRYAYGLDVWFQSFSEAIDKRDLNFISRYAATLGVIKSSSQWNNLRDILIQALVAPDEIRELVVDAFLRYQPNVLLATYAERGDIQGVEFVLDNAQFDNPKYRGGLVSILQKAISESRYDDDEVLQLLLQRLPLEVIKNTNMSYAFDDTRDSARGLALISRTGRLDDTD